MPAFANRVQSASLFKMRDMQLQPAILCAVAFLLLFSSSCLAVRETKFYDILGVSPDADDRTLKKAYKKQAL